MIKVAICDGDGTLQLPNPSPEVQKLIQALPTLGIELTVASNGAKSVVERKFQMANLPVPRFVITPSQIHQKKPSPEFVYRIRDLTGVTLNEIVYIGDDDKTDTFCAINAKILPITALYSNSGKPRNYGLRVTSPEDILHILSIYGKQDGPYFGWSYRETCNDTLTWIDVRALIGDHSGFTDALKQVLKLHQNTRLGPQQLSLRIKLFLYFLSQCYLSGLISEIDYVAVYPGHAANSINPTLEIFLENIAPTFGDRFYRDLLIRHQDAPKSTMQTSRNIYDQFRTIHVNPTYSKRLQGKNILVVDDFTTSGHSLETARRMLLRAGAERVVGVAMAKYRRTHSVTRISKDWDPFAPCTLSETDIKTIDENGEFNSFADAYFRNKILPTQPPP